jgi:hypothetical protein
MVVCYVYFSWECSGQFSRIVLARLLTADVTVVGHWRRWSRRTNTATILPPQPPAGDLPLATPYLHPSIIQLGWQAQIPVWQVGDVQRLTWSSKGGRLLRPDVGVVACFSQRIPQQLLDLPRHGFLNLAPVAAAPLSRAGTTFLDLSRRRAANGRDAPLAGCRAWIRGILPCKKLTLPLGIDGLGGGAANGRIMRPTLN